MAHKRSARPAVDGWVRLSAVIWTSYQTGAGQIVMSAVFTGRRCWKTGAVAGPEETAAVGGGGGGSVTFSAPGDERAAVCPLSQKLAV